MTQPIIQLTMQRGLLEFNRKGRIYLHGQIESDMEYDIFESASVDLESLSDGVYHAGVSHDGTSPTQALLFIWKNIGRTSEPVGLVVAINDLKSIKYAFAKLEEKAQYL